MALATKTFLGDGVTTQYSVVFPLGQIEHNDVTCRVGTEVDGGGDPVYRTITFLSETLMQHSGAPAGVGVPVVFQRKVPVTTLEVNFLDGDAITQKNLDIAQKQPIMLIHEIMDAGPEYDLIVAEQNAKLAAQDLQIQALTDFIMLNFSSMSSPGMTYSSRTTAIASTIPILVAAITTMGYAASGDGGHAMYDRVAVEPTHAGKFQSADGSWWELIKDDDTNVLQFGADRTGATNTQTAIQLAINFVFDKGGGRCRAPNGVYSLGLTTTESYTTTYMPAPYQLSYGLLIKKGVEFIGEGRFTQLKRNIAAPMVIMILPQGDGDQVKNMFLNGNNTNYPISGIDTYGSGAGIGIESTTGTRDFETVLDTLWIEDTPGYGIGVEWGNHIGCNVRNIFINGTGSDGIDTKRMNSGSFVSYNVNFDNIHITNFGRTATDVATQAGFDIRGYVLATNIHIHGVWGAMASVGIRFHGDGDGTVIGGRTASVTNFYVHRDSGGVATTYGILNNGARQASFINGSVRGCHYNCAAIGTYSIFTSVRSEAAVTYGWMIDATSIATQITNCSDYLSPTGMYIAGDKTTISNMMTVNNSTTGTGFWHINIVAGAADTHITGHTPSGNNGSNVNTLGTNTKNFSYYVGTV